MKTIIPNYAKIINAKTGEIESVAVEIMRNRSNSKRGWSRMYRFEYDEVLSNINSKKEYEVFVEIRESNINKTFALNFNQTKIAKKLNTSRNTVARVVRKLRDSKLLVKIDDVFFINANIYAPPMMKDEDVVEAQRMINKHLECEDEEIK